MRDRRLGSIVHRLIDRDVDDVCRDTGRDDEVASFFAKGALILVATSSCERTYEGSLGFFRSLSTDRITESGSVAFASRLCRTTP